MKKFLKTTKNYFRFIYRSPNEKRNYVKDFFDFYKAYRLQLKIEKGRKELGLI